MDSAAGGWYIEGVAYTIELKPRAVKDLRKISREHGARIADALEGLSDGFKGDVKRLTNFTPEYRLRVGEHRVLFEIENSRRIVVYRIRHRRDAYKT